MGTNNSQNMEAPQFSGANLPPQPQVKSNKTILILIGLIILAGLFFWGLKYTKNGTPSKQYLTYAECVSDTKLPCKHYFVGDFGQEWKPSPYKTQQECSEKEQIVGSTCVVPEGNFSDTRWVGSVDVERAKSEQNNSQNLSESSIKTNTYFDGTIKLVDGYYSGKDESGKISPDYYTKIDSIIHGDLNGDYNNDAVVILSSRSGGTGVGRDVAFVLNQKGEAFPIDTFSIIDDRPEIKSIKIENGLVLVTYAPWNGGDTIDKTIQLKLSGSKIEQVKGGDTNTSSGPGTKTYTDNQSQYSIKYPQNWSLTKNGNLISLYGPNADLSSITIKYYSDLNALPLNPKTKKSYGNFEQYVMDSSFFTNQKIVSLGFGTAKSAVLAQDSSYRVLLVGGNGHFYEMTYKERYGQTLSELENILFTFEFTK